MTQELSSIQKRVRALLAKTTENGCTEEEAEAAARKAQELIEKYQVEMTDEEFIEEGATYEKMPLHSVGNLIINQEYKIKPLLAVSLGNFTGCKVWQTRNDQTLHVVGMQSDVMLFRELIDSMTTRAYHLSRAAVADIKGDNRTQRGSWILGFQMGINALVMRHATEKAAEFHRIANASGTQLIVLKDQLVEQKMSEVAPNLRSGRTTSRKVDGYFAQGKSVGLQQNLRGGKSLR